MSARAEVKSILRRADSTVLLEVELSCGEERERAELVILDELFLSVDVAVGEIDGEMLSVLDKFSQTTSAYMSACASFAYVESSLRALYMKLVGKGFSREASLSAIDIVRERGFVDESAIAKRRSELMLGKHWGRARILHKLREEGFPDSVLGEVAASLEDIDFSESCAYVIKRKFSGVPEDRRERERMFASLSRLGFSSADIKKAVRSFSEQQ